ncbi:MAG: UDP-N-acetylmuramate--L-alanine ligase [Clostridia bacterium]|nr:UDP-N-acetylmuramate--L-alanine ligase [Clostridia bacterium]
MALPNTSKSAAEIAVALSGKKKLWFIGIGGVHMATMAQFAAKKGFTVAGSDRAAGEGTARLQAAGIPVYFGHDAARVVDFDAVVYTLAISPQNPEYTAAVRLGLPVFSRADFLAYLMRDYPNRIGVAGSHGKSTVTAMLAEIFTVAGRAPTVFCGAPLRDISPCAAGGGRDVIFEACEYKDSFLRFSPTLSVILNVGLDHVDYFDSMDAIKRSFAAYAALPGEAGAVLCNAEDENALACAAKSPARHHTFGIEKGEYRAETVRHLEGRYAFSPVLPDGRRMDEIVLRVPGRHNVANAMAALAVARLCGVREAAIATGLAAFRGAGRRMEYRGMLHGARLFDDYAHHPAEIVATLSATRQMLEGKGRLFAVFQSHTYSRTAAFFTEICTALRAADRVLVAPIYAARETETLGMSAAVLAAGVGERASAPGDLTAIAAVLDAELSPGDLAVIMGAGDIDRIFGNFSGKHFTL